MAREHVTSRVIPYLSRKYWREKDWERKWAILELLQDQADPGLRKRMLEYLRAPLSPGDEQTQLAQAIALGFVGERYDRFMACYNDRDLLARDVRSVLRAHGLRAEPPIEPPPSPPPPRPQADVSAAVSPNQRLANGIWAGDRAVVERALGDGADLNIKVRSGNYQVCLGLMMAIMLGRYEIAQLLIEQGANVNFTRSDLQGNFEDRRETWRKHQATPQGEGPSIVPSGGS